MTARSSTHRGFTLFELLVSIALMLALLGGLFGFLQNMMESRRHAQDRASQQRAAAMLIERLHRNLLACIPHDEAHGAGLSGDGVSLNLLISGTAPSLAGENPNAAHDDLHVVEYRHDASTQQIQARRSTAVQSASGSGRPNFSSLGGPVARLRLRYHDGSGWRDSFDSVEAGALPTAVEVAVWFELPTSDDFEAEGSDDLEPIIEESTVASDEMGDELPPDRLCVIALNAARIVRRPDSAADVAPEDADPATNSPSEASDSPEGDA